MHSGIGCMARRTRVTKKTHSTGLRYSLWPTDLGFGSGSLIEASLSFREYSRPPLLHHPRYTGAADKAVNLVGCKSPHHQLPVFGWLAMSDACGGNEACSARIKAPAAQRR